MANKSASAKKNVAKQSQADSALAQRLWPALLPLLSLLHALYRHEKGTREARPRGR